jgi:hypothetical protein
MNDLGKMITSDGCKGHSVIKMVWIIYLGVGVFLLVLGLILGSAMDGRIINLGNFGLNLGVVFRMLGFILPVFCLINAAVYNYQVSKTEIKVFEKGISGLGINPKSASERFTFPIFKTPSYASSTFNLTYAQISSVSKAEQQGVNINAAGIIYVVFVKNPDEIMQVINNKMRAK